MKSTRRTCLCDYINLSLISAYFHYFISRGTPDAWIPRDQRLVRLTGKHPFNCEAKLRDLYAEGFLTPTNLFYVRNHGAVPRFDREKANNWELRIHGYKLLLRIVLLIKLPSSQPLPQPDHIYPG